MKYVIYKRNEIYDMIPKDNEIMYIKGNPGVVYVQEWEPPVVKRHVLFKNMDGNFKVSISRFASRAEFVVNNNMYLRTFLGFLNDETGELEHE